MKSKLTAVATVSLLCVLSVVLYAQFNSKPSIPDVETASHFALADQDKDNSVSKEEFQSYLEARQAAASVKNAYVRPVSNTTVKICPNSGEPCTHGGEGGCSQEAGAVRMGGMGGGCCKEMGDAMPAGGCCKEKK